MNVFSYWEGPMPWHIGVCLRSVKQACSSTCRFQLATPGNVWDLIPVSALHHDFSRLLTPAHRADCIRAALLAYHGGFYFDADTVGLRCPGELLADKAAGREMLYCVWDKEPRRVLNGYIYAAPDSSLAKRWLEAVNLQLAKIVDNGPHVPWTAYGEMLLTPIIESELDLTLEIPRRTFLPIDVDSNVKLFFEYGETIQHVRDDTVCFGLSNSWMLDKHPNEMALLGTRDARASDLLVHRLFTEAERRLGLWEL